MQGVRYRLLQWAAGIFCIIIGAMMLVVPHQLNLPTDQTFQPGLALWGGLFVLAGAALLMTVVFDARPWLVTLVHVLVGGLLLLFAVQLAQIEAWISAANHAILGLTILSIPLLDRWQRQPGRVDLFALMMAVTAILDGLMLPIRMAQLNTPASELARTALPPVAVASILVGLLVLTAEYYPAIPSPVHRGGYVLLGILSLAWFILAFPVMRWVGYAWYSEFGVLLIMLPWLGPRLAQPRADSLRVRLTLALVLVATVPLMIQMALTTNREEQTAIDQALTFQRRLVTTQSEHIANYVDLYRSAANAFAAQPGLLTMTPAERQKVVMAFKAAYPDTLLAATYDRTGAVLTRSDGAAGPALSDLDVYKAIRTTNKPYLQITMARTFKRMAFVFGAPIQDAAGQFAGVALFSVDTVRLNDILYKSNVDGRDIVYLVDDQGRVIVHPDDSLVQVQADLSQRPPVARLLAEPGLGVMIDTSQADSQVTAYTRVPGVGWGIVAQRPLALTMAGIWAERDVAFALLAALVVVAILIGGGLARNLTAPLWNVADALNRLAPSGQVVDLGNLGRLAEIRLLAAAFNRLQQRLADRTGERDHAERTLREERERLQVTLTSIGDAVMVTDTQGRVTFMNPVASALTGWSPDEAQGQPLDVVFPIVNEVSRQPVENPVHRVLRENAVAGLANHTILLAKDGREIPIDDSGAPIRDADGAVIGVVLVFRDITHRRQSERETAAASAEADRERRRLAAVLEALPVGVAIADSNGLAIQNNAQLDQIWNGVPRVSEVEGYRQFKGWWVDSGKAVEPEEWALTRASLAGERVIGQFIDIERFDGERRTILNSGAPIFDEHGCLIGGVVAVQDITDRKRAEDRLAFLADVGALLTSSLDLDLIAQRLPGVMVPRWADTFALDVCDPGDQALHRLACGTSYPEAAGALRVQAIPPACSPIEAALASHQSLLLPDLSAADDPNLSPLDLEPYRRIGCRSLLVIPVIVGDTTIGVMSLSVGPSGRCYSDDDRVLGEVVAGRIGIVLENARLYQSERQARTLAEMSAAQVARLQAITAALSGALTPQEVGTVILSQGAAAVGANSGGILQCEDDALRPVYSTGYPPAQLKDRQRIPLDAPTPMVDAIRTNSAIWLESPDAMTTHYPRLPFDEMGLGRNAWAVLPLKVSDHTVGAMTLAFPTSRSFSPEDKAFILALAQQCAQALERANLYDQVRRNADVLEQTVAARTEELRQAVERAESADRAKMVMLSTVTHEMRTPLNSIVGFSRLLMKNQPPEKAAVFTSAINSEGRRLARLIDDFLDLQRIDSGREVFHFDTLDLDALIRDVVTAQENGEYPPHVLSLNADPVRLIYADSDRIRQVIVNLLSNAYKYSPEGSTVTIRLKEQAGAVLVSVQDQGLGIPPDDLPHLFERFKRGEIAEELRIQGIGLGLSLCREIVQAHHGRIWAESPGPNLGSTFSFTLPLALAQPPEEHS